MAMVEATRADLKNLDGGWVNIGASSFFIDTCFLVGWNDGGVMKIDQLEAVACAQQAIFLLKIKRGSPFDAMLRALFAGKARPS